MLDVNLRKLVLEVHLY